MAIKHILLHVDNTKNNAARLDAAIDLALKHEAHLTGLYVIPRVDLPIYAEVQIPADILQAQEEALQETAQEVENNFKAVINRAGCMGEWHSVQGFVDQQINQHARYADLVIIGQAEEQAADNMAVEDHVLMGSARPVLFIPYIGASAPIGQRIMVAWNGSREAIRAVNDALPLLERANLVDVLAVNPTAADGDIPTADICQYLARHGVKAEASQTVAKDIKVSDVLLSRASDRSIDLIVMGAYSHSRWREYILGGVTHNMLKYMTVPVLMSH